MCTAAPIGRITTAATRSEEIAVDGLTAKSRPENDEGIDVHA
jgi:hypothetical protein